MGIIIGDRSGIGRIALPRPRYRHSTSNSVWNSARPPPFVRGDHPENCRLAIASSTGEAHILTDRDGDNPPPPPGRRTHPVLFFRATAFIALSGGSRPGAGFMTAGPSGGRPIWSTCRLETSDWVGPDGSEHRKPTPANTDSMVAERPLGTAWTVPEGLGECC